MLAFKDNPYTWDASSKGIKSSVIDFSLKTGNGSAIEVSGLSKPVELFLPQKKESDEKTNTTTPVFFAKPSVGSNNMRLVFSQKMLISSSRNTFALRFSGGSITNCFYLCTCEHFTHLSYWTPSYR